MQQQGKIISLGKDDFSYLPGITLGASIQIKIEGLGTAQTYLVGMVPGEFFIIPTPLLANIGSKLFEKNHIIVRYICAGRVYGFRCTLIELIKKPYRLSILSYPDTIECINLRKHERIPCFIDSQIAIGGGFHNGNVTDISMGGCSFEFLASGDELPQCKMNDTVSIAIRFDAEEAAAVFDATVRNVRVDTQKMIAGLSFIKSGMPEKDARSAKALQDYILLLMND